MLAAAWDYLLAVVHHDRGRSARTFADDQIVLISKGGQVSRARLCDRSPHGFRVKHTAELSAGDQARVLLPSACYLTEVVWSTPDEAGLRVLQRTYLN